MFTRRLISIQFAVIYKSTIFTVKKLGFQLVKFVFEVKNLIKTKKTKNKNDVQHSFCFTSEAKQLCYQ